MHVTRGQRWCERVGVRCMLQEDKGGCERVGVRYMLQEDKGGVSE